MRVLMRACACVRALVKDRVWAVDQKPRWENSNSEGAWWPRETTTFFHWMGVKTR